MRGNKDDDVLVRPRQNGTANGPETDEEFDGKTKGEKREGRKDQRGEQGHAETLSAILRGGHALTADANMPRLFARALLNERDRIVHVDSRNIFLACHPSGAA